MSDWDELDEKYGRKVDYWTTATADATPLRRTAYLDTTLGEGRYSGTEKHTDTPVIVRWTGERYVEEHP
jgi:hypothetical protein